MRNKEPEFSVSFCPSQFRPGFFFRISTQAGNILKIQDILKPVHNIIFLPG
jgi:hypothetical protein